MLTIYTTEDIVSSIMNDPDDKYATWKLLFKKIKLSFNVLLNETTDLDKNDDNPLLSISKGEDQDLQIESKNNSTIDKLINLDSNVVIAPGTILLIDVSEEIAKKISLKYGVICHPLHVKPEDNPIFRDCIERNIEKDDSPHSWNHLLNISSPILSNALIMTDRYLFSKDSGNITYKDGVENVFEILDSILPKNLNVDYHILFVFDATKIDHATTFEEVSTKLNKLKKRLNRAYPINIETLSVEFSQDDENYKKTHNRRIISNYFIIRAEHSLRAFRNNVGLYTQSLFFDWAASKGIIKQVNSDIPDKALSKCIRDMQKIINTLKNSKEVNFTQNGKSNMPLSELKNRLIHNNL